MIKYRDYQIYLIVPIRVYEGDDRWGEDIVLSPDAAIGLAAEALESTPQDSRREWVNGLDVMGWGEEEE